MKTAREVASAVRGVKFRERRVKDVPHQPTACSTFSFFFRNRCRVTNMRSSTLRGVLAGTGHRRVLRRSFLSARQSWQSSCPASQQAFRRSWSSCRRSRSKVLGAFLRSRRRAAPVGKLCVPSSEKKQVTTPANRGQRRHVGWCW